MFYFSVFFSFLFGVRQPRELPSELKSLRQSLFSLPRWFEMKSTRGAWWIEFPAFKTPAIFKKEKIMNNARRIPLFSQISLWEVLIAKEIQFPRRASLSVLTLCVLFGFFKAPMTSRFPKINHNERFNSSILEEKTATKENREDRWTRVGSGASLLTSSWTSWGEYRLFNSMRHCCWSMNVTNTYCIKRTFRGRENTFKMVPVWR